MNVPPPYPQEIPVTRRPGMSPAMIILLVIGGCLVGVLLVAGILAALMFPVFSQARESARLASCQSNMKQLGTALAMYTQDYDERMPPKETWQDNLFPYLKNSAVFNCPADRGMPYGYAFNARLDRLSLDRVLSPMTAPSIFESRIHVPNGFDMLESWDPRHRSGSGGPRGVVAYVDGHVKAETIAPAAGAGLSESE
jgi:prepilin-type processing-associated H-X9-DG protein